MSISELHSRGYFDRFGCNLGNRLRSLCLLQCLLILQRLPQFSQALASDAWSNEESTKLRNQHCWMNEHSIFLVGQKYFAQWSKREPLAFVARQFLMDIGIRQTGNSKLHVCHMRLLPLPKISHLSNFTRLLTISPIFLFLKSSESIHYFSTFFASILIAFAIFSRYIMRFDISWTFCSSLYQIIDDYERRGGKICKPRYIKQVTKCNNRMIFVESHFSRVFFSISRIVFSWFGSISLVVWGRKRSVISCLCLCVLFSHFSFLAKNGFWTFSYKIMVSSSFLQ